jgi:hypothetical protein
MARAGPPWPEPGRAKGGLVATARYNSTRGGGPAGWAGRRSGLPVSEPDPLGPAGPGPLGRPEPGPPGCPPPKALRFAVLVRIRQPTRYTPRCGLRPMVIPRSPHRDRHDPSDHDDAVSVITDARNPQFRREKPGVVVEARPGRVEVRLPDPKATRGKSGHEWRALSGTKALLGVILHGCSKASGRQAYVAALRCRRCDLGVGAVAHGSC